MSIRIGGVVVGLGVMVAGWGPCPGPTDAGCLRYSGTTCILVGHSASEHSASEHRAATCLEHHARMSRSKLADRVLPAPTEWDTLIAACECIRWFPADGKECPEATEFRTSIERQCTAIPPSILRPTPDSEYWL